MDGKKKKNISPADVAGVILCLIFIPLIVLNLSLIVNSYINPSQLPGVFGIKPAIVLSGSMEPAISTGDLIFIHETDTAELADGDVICFMSSGKAVTHRIAEIQTDESGKVQYVTRGDGNDAEDRETVTPEQIQGIWKGERIGRVGNFILFMQTPAGMVIFIIVPLLLFFLWDIWRRHKADKAEAARLARLEAELEALRPGKEGE